MNYLQCGRMQRRPISARRGVEPTRGQSPKKNSKKRGRRRREGPTAWQGSGVTAPRPRASAASEARRKKRDFPKGHPALRHPCVCSGVCVARPCVCSGVCVTEWTPSRMVGERHARDATASERSERSLIDEVCAALFMTGCCVSRWLVLCVPGCGVVCFIVRLVW